MAILPEVEPDVYDNLMKSKIKRNEIYDKNMNSFSYLPVRESTYNPGTFNQIDHCMIYGRHFSDVIDVKPLDGSRGRKRGWERSFFWTHDKRCRGPTTKSPV
jgi:hypothetical protein